MPITRGNLVSRWVFFSSYLCMRLCGSWRYVTACELIFF